MVWGKWRIVALEYMAPHLTRRWSGCHSLRREPHGSDSITKYFHCVGSTVLTVMFLPHSHAYFMILLDAMCSLHITYVVSKHIKNSCCLDLCLFFPAYKPGSQACLPRLFHLGKKTNELLASGILLPNLQNDLHESSVKLKGV